MYYNVVVSYRCVLVSTYNLTCERPFTLNIYIRFVFFNCSKKDLVCCHFFYWLVISRIPFSCVPFHLLDRYLTIWTDNNFFPTYLVQPTSPMTPQRSPLRPSNQDTTKRRQVRLSPLSYPWQPYSSCVGCDIFLHLFGKLGETIGSAGQSSRLIHHTAHTSNQSKMLLPLWSHTPAKPRWT